MDLSLVIQGYSQLCSSSFRKKPRGTDRLLMMYKSSFLRVINACKGKHYGGVGVLLCLLGTVGCCPKCPTQEVLLHRQGGQGRHELKQNTPLLCPSICSVSVSTSQCPCSEVADWLWRRDGSRLHAAQWTCGCRIPFCRHHCWAGRDCGTGSDSLADEYQLWRLCKSSADPCCHPSACAAHSCGARTLLLAPGFKPISVGSGWGLGGEWEWLLASGYPMLPSIGWCSEQDKGLLPWNRRVLQKILWH